MQHTMSAVRQWLSVYSERVRQCLVCSDSCGRVQVETSIEKLIRRFRNILPTFLSTAHVISTKGFLVTCFPVLSASSLRWSSRRSFACDRTQLCTVFSPSRAPNRCALSSWAFICGACHSITQPCLLHQAVADPSVWWVTHRDTQ